MDRREVLRLVLGGLGAQALDRLAPAELLAIGRRTHAAVVSAREEAPLLVLDRSLNRLVVAAAERILPATGTPGATAAGVNRFVDRLLADWYPPGDRDRLLAGLRDLERASLERFGSAFADCSEAQQTALLTEFDEQVARLRQEPRTRTSDEKPPTQHADDHWFAMLKFVTIWGFYTSEVGIVGELRDDPMPGHYDGCAPLTAGRAEA